MPRIIHRWTGLVASILLLVLSLSGVALSVLPAAESLSAPGGASGLSVADLAARVEANMPLVERIHRSANGQISASWFGDAGMQNVVVDPATGQAVADAGQSAVSIWLTELHRSLFLGDSGRLIMAAAAAAMLFLTITGALVVVRRTGGWKRFFAPLKGPLAGRLHAELSRVAVIGFALSSVTALWMTAGTFGLIPEPVSEPPFPSTVSGTTDYPLAEMEVLMVTPLDRLRELTFPFAGDNSDVYTLMTDAGTGYIDQGTGKLLAWQHLSVWGNLNEIIYMLHTGQGAPLLALVLGLIALGIPALGFTGLLVWMKGQRGRPKIRNNVHAGQAETILLVGSEGGSTWGFAATLHKSLTEAGQKVHTAPMSAFAPNRHRKAERFIVLAATYGEGDMPASARGFIEKLAGLDEAPSAPLAVLGFGDSSFPAFCAYGDRVAQLAQEKGWASLMDMATIDRQSPQEFARWGRDLGAVLGIDLELHHQAVLPRTRQLTLIERRDFGEDQVNAAILRFSLLRPSLWEKVSGQGFAGYSAGDLLGVIPQGSPVPRFYSMAASARDGFVEICVRRHEGGLCSGQLVELKEGDTIEAFRRPNPEFRPNRGKAPVILVGAGTGIGPLAGFIRGNHAGRPMHLYFGARTPGVDLSYDHEMPNWHKDGNLSSLNTAFSRGETRAYVQDVIRADATHITRDIAAGGQVLVCGGRDMARGVSEALADILAPMGLSPAVLKAEGRYAEDTY